MTDIVERLHRNAGWRDRDWRCITDPAMLAEAATEIERLRKHAEAMAGALGEIMALPGEINPSNYDHDDVCELNRQFVYGYEIARIPLAAYRAEYPEEK